MERDPLLLAWRASRAGHLIVALASLLAVPAALLVMDLPRQAVVHWPQVEAGGAILDLWAVPGLAALRGFAATHFSLPALPALSFGWLGTGLLVFGALALRTVFFLLVDLWRAASTARAVARRAERLGERLAEVGSLKDLEARELVSGAADALVRLEPTVAGAITIPLFAAARIGLGVLYGTLIDPRLGLSVLASTLLVGLAADRRLRQRGREQLALATRRRALAGASRELVRRWPLIRAHGTARTEAAFLGSRVARPALMPLRGLFERLPGVAGDAVVLAAPLLAFLLVAGQGGEAGVAVAALIAFVTTMAPARLIGEWRLAREAGAADAQIVADAFAILAIRGEAGASSARGEALHRPSGLALDGVTLSAEPAMDGPGELPLSVELAPGSHLGIVVASAPDADRLAAAIAGLEPPGGGAIRLAGLPIGDLPLQERTRRIGHAAGRPILVAGSMGDNLAYGLAPDERAALSEADWALALDASGLRPEVEARALGASIDPSRRPGLAERILSARAAVARDLAASDLDTLVERFEPERFNRYATIGENLLFGVPVGETFDARHLPAHPFTRAVLEAQGLTRPLAEMGYAIAEALLDLFAEIPDGHPLFARFSFFAAADRGAIAEIVGRKGPRRRGPGAAADRMRLLDLALRYVETRHRLGLVDEAMEARIVAARRSFRELLPPSLRSVVDFYDPAEICPSASFADNLLFGRIAFDLAGAETKVGAIVREVIEREGLTGDMVRLGLGTRVAVDDGRLIQPGIDIARCVLRKVDILVAARPAAGLPDGEARLRMARLSQAIAGRMLVVVDEPGPVEVLGRTVSLIAEPSAPKTGDGRNLA